MGLGDCDFEDLRERHRINSFSVWKMGQCHLVTLALGTVYSREHVPAFPPRAIVLDSKTLSWEKTL